jgi:hypothetical protein
VIAWTQGDAVELSRRGQCREDNPETYDAVDPASDAARHAIVVCHECPVRELCELVLLHREDGARSGYTGVAAGRVWLNGREVTTSPRRVERATPVDTRSSELTDWLAIEGDPDVIRAAHVRWNSGKRDTADRRGEQAYQRARARMARAAARAPVSA